jgi:hypothetical protein
MATPEIFEAFSRQIRSLKEFIYKTILISSLIRCDILPTDTGDCCNVEIRWPKDKR